MIWLALEIRRQRRECRVFPLLPMTKYTLERKRSLLFVLVGLIGLVVAACQNVDDVDPSRFTFQLNTCLRPTCEEVTVKRGDVTVSVPLSGTLRYVRKADVSFGVSGRIASVEVSVGDVVETGQVIAILETPFLELAVLNAKTFLQQAEESLAESLKPLTTTELLNAERAVSAAKVIVERAEKDLRQAMAGPAERELAQANASVIAAEIAVPKAEQVLRSARVGPTDRELAESEATLANSNLALQIAEENLAELKSDVDPLRVSEQENRLALAEINLKEARQWLAQLKLGPAPEIVSQAQFEFDNVKFTLLSSQLALERLKENPGASQMEMVLAIARVDRATFDVKVAETALKQAKSGPTDRELAEAEAAVISADFSVQEAERNLELTKAGPNEKQIAEAEVAVANANLTLEVADERHAELKEGIGPLRVKELENLLVLAQAALNEAQKRLTELESGSDPVIVNEMQRSLNASRDDLFNAEQNSARLTKRGGESNLELNRVQIEVAKAALVEAEERLNNSRMFPPFGGLVVALNVETGQRVSESEAIVQLVDTSTLEMRAVVSDVGQLKEGQETRIIIESLQSMTIPGHITGISAIIAGEHLGETFYEVIIFGESLAAAGLREGVSARAEALIQQRSDVLFVPIAAVQQDGQQSTSVEVVIEGGVNSVTVTSGLNNGQVIEVTDGLRENDIVRVRRANISLLVR